MHLSAELFKTIVTYTPLIAIDLVVRNKTGRVLLGKRINRPAQGYWFVPGGRVLKDESLDAAFARLVKTELGIHQNRSQADWLGVYEHHYDDCFAGEGTSTHYVVLAYQLRIDDDRTLPQEQHSAYRWMHPDKLLADALVHKNTKAYFIPC